jgi:hypothetical protein
MGTSPFATDEVFSVRIRPLVALSVAALAALTLAGCSGSASPSPSASSSASADLCSARAKDGSATDAIKVSGDVGKVATATFKAPLDVTDVESKTVVEGKGEKLKDGDLAQIALTAFTATDGKSGGSAGQTEGSLLPAQVSTSGVLGKILGCATTGSRVVATVPGDESNPALVYVVDVLKIVPQAAWGTAVTPKSGFPTVTLAKDGEPSVKLPSGSMPTAFEKETLKKGDGLTVASGDSVIVQYYGVSWNTGKVFDKSWGKQLFPFTVGSGVVQGFSDAVSGETVGSQVLAVLPPSVAYGEGKINDSDLKGQTLVFVIDILGVQHAAK